MDAPLRVRATETADLDWVLDRERAPENASWIVAWTRERHLAAMRAVDEAHYVAEVDGALAGYAIMRGLTDEHGSIELTRIVVHPHGAGLGRGLLRWLVRNAFEELGAYRLWLDVLEHNVRARALYASEGFVGEGHLRNAVLIEGQRESLVVMSMLEPDFRRRLAVDGTETRV